MLTYRHKCLLIDIKFISGKTTSIKSKISAKDFAQKFSSKFLAARCFLVLLTWKILNMLHILNIFQLTFMCKLAVFVNKNTYQKTLTLLNLKIYNLLFSATVSTIKFQNYKVFLILQSMTSLEFVGWNFCTFWLSVEVMLISRDSVKTQQTYCFRPRYTLMYH